MQWLNLSDGVNSLALLGAGVILLLTIVIMGLYLKKIKDSKGDGQALEHTWDGIGEFANNVPVGWVACFLAVFLWGFWYFFVGYPLSSFSQIGQYNEEVKNYNNSYEQRWSNLDNSELREMGLSIFQVQCATCHGPNADGMDGKAQNLISWGKEDGIIKTIRLGSKGLGYMMDEMMPLDLSDDEAKAVAAYVMQDISYLHSTKYPTEAARGKDVFDTYCAACHGEDGKGAGGMAPDLSTYGTTAFLDYALTNGKKGSIGIMPSFEYANFADKQKEAINAYINSLIDND